MTTIAPIAAVYLHWPFCRRRCFYCDFPIVVVGDRPTPGTDQWIADYCDLLCQEIAATPVLGPALTSVFFGGGTPSLVPPRYLEQVLTALDRRFGLAHEGEISLEIDPGTFTLEQLRDYQRLGINRWSLGVQAFQDELLAVCGRCHRREDGDRAIGWLHQLGIANFSLDLISGLPGQTLDHWQESLDLAIAAGPAHLSCYDLVLEPQTPFGKRYAPGDRPLPSDELAATMYRRAVASLTAGGWEHYEISNYAKPGFQCRHNRVYWQNQPYYAMGMGAASFVDNRRFSRPRKRQEYQTWLTTWCQNPQHLPGDRLSPGETWLETLMLGLRLAEGLDLKILGDRFGADKVDQLKKVIAPYGDHGWVQWGEGRVRLGDPEGFLYSNTILSAIFAAFEEEEGDMTRA